jgi:hypothetical protein
MKRMKEYDKKYSSWLGIFNPYETFHHKLNPKIPMFDLQAYKLNPRHRHVYDKLFVVQSQYIPGGELSDLKNANFPIFIKPRWGHKTASSKDCYKIKSSEELKPHLHKKNMMWSSFIDAKEGMTDFILVNGEIVYQLTYEYSEKQYGFADVWKYISSENVPPYEVVEWVKKHLVGYTGPLNVQYRDTVIIEVGMRFARSGMYIESTNHKPLIDAINHMWETKTWSCREDLTIQPFYSFKCWSPCPVICLLPQHVIDMIMKSFGSMCFYEYYFEPTGKSSTVFFQFLHTDFETGMKLKVTIERLLLFINILFIGCCLMYIISHVLGMKYKPLLWIVVALLILSLDNSLNVIYNQITHQKQFIM